MERRTASIMDPGLLQVSFITRMTTSSISFSASTVMATAIILRIRKPGQSNPYRRILLGLSISDIIQSSSMFIGPFAPPRETPDALWSIGNTATCDANGFFLNASAAAIPMYTFGLSIYFLYRIKYGMSREDFANRIEKKWHAFILLWTIVGNLYALFTKQFNSLVYGTACMPADFPLNCLADPDTNGECTRGKQAMIVGVITAYLPALISFGGIIISLCILTKHVFYQTKISRMMSMRSSTNTNTNAADAADSQGEEPLFVSESKNITSSTSSIPSQSDSGTIDSNVLHSGVAVGQPQPQPPQTTSSENVQPLDVLATYRKEMLIQSCLYTFGFLFTYSFVYIILVIRITGKPLDSLLHLANSITWPIGGLINILIYTRPQIALMRIRYPDFSWMKAFFMVILNGVGVPDERSSDVIANMVSRNESRLRSGNQHSTRGLDVIDEDREAGAENKGWSSFDRMSTPSATSAVPNVSMNMKEGIQFDVSSAGLNDFDTSDAKLSMLSEPSEDRPRKFYKLLDRSKLFETH